jgi:hypothetical protein
MCRIRKQWALAAWVLVFLTMTFPAWAAPIDSTLFTTYTLNGNDLNWLVCGSTAQTSGCYGSGSIGPFGIIGAMIEGNPTTSGSTVTRYIYVVDIGSNGNGVDVYVYKKTDTVTATSDTVSVTLYKTVSLPLIGGSGASCSMAANNGYLFIGTDQSPQAVQVQKSNLNVTQLGGFSPPLNVTAITADSYGYVTITQGGTNGSVGAFTVIGPKGTFQEDGGGNDFMLDTLNAVTPSMLPK